MLVQIAGHHGETGGDDAAFVACAGNNVEGHCGAHVENDGGYAVVLLHGDGIGDTVLADFFGIRIRQIEAAAGFVCEVKNGQIEPTHTGLQVRIDSWHNGAKRDADDAVK